MIANRTLNALLTAAALTCSVGIGHSSPDFVEWDTIDVALPDQILGDGATSRMTQTSNLSDANPGKVFSLGVFKMGSIHRVTLESLTAAGSPSEEVTFSVGWFIPWGHVHFHTHNIFQDQSATRFHWAPTYDSLGVMKGGEIELFAVLNPQFDTTRIRVHYYGNAAKWVSPAGKTEVDSYQLPLTQVEASQTNHSWIQYNNVYLKGTGIYANGSPILSQATAPGFLNSAGYLNNSSAATYLTTNGYLKKATGSGATAHSTALLALGPDASASGSNSLAIGRNTNASSTGAIAIGVNANAASNEALAFGSQAYATNSNATAINYGWASGVHSFAASYAAADGLYSLAMSGGYAMEDFSVAIGGFDPDPERGNESFGLGSVSLGGRTNSALGDYSYAMGWNSVAAGDHSYSTGYLTKAGAYAAALGARNLTTGNLMPNASANAWVEEGALFELGNGNPGASEYSNAITTLKNGRTTLTNKAWLAAVTLDEEAALEDPASTTDSGGTALVVEGHTELKGKVIISEQQGDISMGIYD